MAQSKLNNDAIAAELRDSQAAHKKNQKLPVKNLKPEFEVQQVGLQPYEQGIQSSKKSAKPFFEWLREVEKLQKIDKFQAHLQDQQLRREENMEYLFKLWARVEEFIIWYQRYISGMQKIWRDLESEQGNIPVPPQSPQKKNKSRIPGIRTVLSSIEARARRKDVESQSVN